MEIENLAIDPDYQGQRLAASFIDYAKDHARQLGVTSIFNYVDLSGQGLLCQTRL